MKTAPLQTGWLAGLYGDLNNPYCPDSREGIDWETGFEWGWNYGRGRVAALPLSYADHAPIEAKGDGRAHDAQWLEDLVDLMRSCN